MAEEVRRILDEYKEDTKRHFDVVAERLEDKIETVSEQVGVNTEKITALQDDVSKVKDNIEVIKLDIEFIKNELKQKVSRDEFAALEKRVSMMEIKLNKLS